jgi:hypothetical protein
MDCVRHCEFGSELRSTSGHIITQCSPGSTTRMKGGEGLASRTTQLIPQRSQRTAKAYRPQHCAELTTLRSSPTGSKARSLIKLRSTSAHIVAVCSTHCAAVQPISKRSAHHNAKQLITQSLPRRTSQSQQINEKKRPQRQRTKIIQANETPKSPACWNTTKSPWCNGDGNGCAVNQVFVSAR